MREEIARRVAESLSGNMRDEGLGTKREGDSLPLYPGGNGFLMQNC
jgi:hypothetical protein